MYKIIYDVKYNFRYIEIKIQKLVMLIGKLIIMQIKLFDQNQIWHALL